MGQGDGAIRHQLLALARRRRARLVRFTTERPCRWEPTTVLNPETGAPFTPAGAWEFIADMLEQKRSIEQVRLRKPPGRVGHVMLVPTKHGTIYIKLELGSGVIWGRSFHYSAPNEGEVS